MKIKSIRIRSALKFSAFTSALFGFMAGIGNVILIAFSDLEWSRLSAGSVGAMVGAGIGSALAFTFFGVLAGVAAALFYNFAAAIVGGVELDAE